MAEEKKSTPEAISKRAKKMAADAQAEVKDTTTSMTAAVHKVLLAGVGAVALSKDELEDFVAKLVERGEIAEQDGRKLVKEIWDRRRSDTEQKAGELQETAEGRVERVEAAVDEQIERILTRLNVPTKSDIDALSEKIGVLSQKVDSLKSA